jgi:hypothetical protein
MKNGPENREPNGYRTMLLLLVALAVLSSATKDLNQLQNLLASMHQFAAEWNSDGLFTASAAAVSISEAACAESVGQNNRGQDFNWHGLVAAGKAVEIKGLHGDISAEPSSGNEVEVTASKRSDQSDANAVSIKVIEHEGGVTICAIYPTSDPNVFTPCRPSRGTVKTDTEDYAESVEVQKSDVRVNFRIKVPAGVDFIARTINGEINADSMAGNVFAKTVNGGIRLSTSGYADAKTVNGEVSAKLGASNWSGPINFKTVNGEIKVELPASVGAVINASTLHGEISSDFPLTVMSKFSKRQVRGTIGGGGRELNLKTVNGSITLRRVG